MKFLTGFLTASLVAMAMALDQSSSSVIPIHVVTFGGPMVASVVNANADATTYHYECANNSAYGCPMPGPGTLISGPSTASARLLDLTSESGWVILATTDLECKITPTASLTCFTKWTAESTSKPPKSAPTYITTSGTGPNITANYALVHNGSVTVTAGFDKLSPSTAVASTSKSQDSATETSSGMGAIVTAGAGSGMGLAAAAGVAAAAVFF